MNRRTGHGQDRNRLRAVQGVRTVRPGLPENLYRDGEGDQPARVPRRGLRAPRRLHGLRNMRRVLPRRLHPGVAITLASAEIRRELMKGNEAICVGAIAAGCRFYYGYPITPQNDIPEYMSAHLPPIGGMFLQAESEVATINFLLGTSASGMRVMTSSSGPGISLMQEGLSYMAGSELPAVIVNISRSGPGLGGIAPSQGDYFQAVKCGGHGGDRGPVLAPHPVQGMYSLTLLAFALARQHRNPAMILGDAIVGQMKEPFEATPYDPASTVEKPWALTGCVGRERRRGRAPHP